MQLGTRWQVGAQPPARLPDAVRTAIHEAELAAGAEAEASRSWTLTWLEGLPIVTLDARVGDAEQTEIRYRPDTDTATINADNPGEEWVEDEL